LFERGAGEGMSKPYDATLKTMLEASPLDWPGCFKE
jgi:hypothetical protein